MDEQFVVNIQDPKFDEYIEEKIDLKKFNEMQKDRSRFLVEAIVQKPVEKRSLEEKRFFAWHLKFKMPFFHQYPYEQLSALTEKFTYFPEAVMSETHSNPVVS